MKYLVTGASGKLGRRVLTALRRSEAPGDVAVLVRTPEQAALLNAEGFDVRHGDYDQPEGLAAALQGVDRMLLISASSFDDDTRIRQHQSVVDAAVEADVPFLAYTSLPRADTTAMSVAVVHKAAEEAIRRSGIPYAFLRNNWYLENEIEEIDTVQRALAGEPVVTAAGDGRTGWVLREELGEAAAAALVGRADDNSVYELSGAPSTYDDLAAALSSVAGRQVPVLHVDDAAFRADLNRRGVPWADLLVDFQAELRAGLLDVDSDDLAFLLQRQPTPLTPAVGRLVNEFGLR